MIFIFFNSHICLNPYIDDHHFIYITKLGKKNLSNFETYLSQIEENHIRPIDHGSKKIEENTFNPSTVVLRI
jgi:hypothetical protein